MHDERGWDLARRLAGALTSADVAAAVAGGAARASGSRSATLTVGDAESGPVELLGPGGAAPTGEPSTPSITTLTAVSHALRTGAPVLIGSVTHAPRDVAVAEGSDDAIAVLPVRSLAGRVTGAIGFAWDSPQEFLPDQLRTLEQIAGAVGAALGRTARGDRPDAPARNPTDRFAVFDGVLDGITALEPIRSDDGTVVDFRVVYANSAAKDVVGRPIAEFVGRSVADLYPEALTVDLWDKLRRVIDTGDPFEGVDLQYEADVEGVRSTGWYRVLATRHEDFVITAHRDTTERRTRDIAWARQQAEAQLLGEAFLPASLPETGDLEVAAAFLPASDAPMGGDWYDVFPVDGGICLVIGDVAGHGLRSAAMMAQLRNAVRAFAYEDPSPASVLTRLNKMLHRLEPGETATAIIAVWNPDTRVIVRAEAGHPPVLRCRAGEFGYLEPAAPGLMLGVDPEWRYVNVPKLLRRGTTLVLFTDGLIEARGEGIDVSMERLRAYVEQFSELSPQWLCKELLSWAIERGRRDDDVCVLAVRIAC